MQDGGIAADDERQTTETFDAMCNSYGKLLVEIFGTALRSTHRGERMWKGKHQAGHYPYWTKLTRIWWPSGDFPEYNRVASVRRTEAWEEIDNHFWIKLYTSHRICAAWWYRFSAQQQLKNISTHVCKVNHSMSIPWSARWGQINIVKQIYRYAVLQSRFERGKIHFPHQHKQLIIFSLSSVALIKKKTVSWKSAP